MKVTLLLVILSVICYSSFADTEWLEKCSSPELPEPSKPKDSGYDGIKIDKNKIPKYDKENKPVNDDPECKKLKKVECGKPEKNKEKPDSEKCSSPELPEPSKPKYSGCDGTKIDKIKIPNCNKENKPDDPECKKLKEVESGKPKKNKEKPDSEKCSSPELPEPSKPKYSGCDGTKIDKIKIPNCNKENKPDDPECKKLKEVESGKPKKNKEKTNYDGPKANKGCPEKINKKQNCDGTKNNKDGAPKKSGCDK